MRAPLSRRPATVARSARSTPAAGAAAGRRARRRARRAGRRVARRGPRTPGCRAGHRRAAASASATVAREHAHAVERARRRHDAVGRDEAERRLEADDAVERCGDPSRPGSVGADAEVGDPERDGERRAGARPAADVLRRPGARDGPVRRAGADEARRELVEVALAEHDRAGRRRGRCDGGRRARRACRCTRGMPAVVGRPATSMLSLTATVRPASGSVLAARDGRVRRARHRERVGLRPERDPHVRPVDLGDAAVGGGDAARRAAAGDEGLGPGDVPDPPGRELRVAQRDVLTSGSCRRRP